MIDVALMIEGQMGLTWERWQRIAQAAEDLGFVGLYRSDHFTNAQPPDQDALDCWIALAWLASHTRRIVFGPLVSPVSFRHPVIMARQAAAIDDLAGGRLHLGVGAGWQEREHRAYGFPLLEPAARMDRLAEALEVITRLLRSETPVSFAGRYYRLEDALLLPRPRRPGGPPLVIGGNGPRRTLPLVARYADEWNAVMIDPATFAERNRQLDHLLREQGRQPGEVRRSLMTGLIFGRDDAQVRQRLRGRDPEALRQRGALVGTAAAIVEQIGAFAEAGVQRIMLQWLDLDDLDGLEALSRDVLSRLR